MAKIGLFRLDEFLPYRLNRLAAELSARLSRVYRQRHGLARAEWRVLATLGEFPGMTAKAIGAHSAMHKTKVSRAVASLEKRRWLRRSRDEQDRRFERLELTAAGRAAYDDLVPLMLAFERALLWADEGRGERIAAGLAELERALEIGGNDKKDGEGEKGPRVRRL